MKKATIISLTIVLVLCIAGCSNGAGEDFTETQATGATTPETSTTSLDDITIYFPERHTVYTGVDDPNDFEFTRQYRFCFYVLSHSYPRNIDSVSLEAYNEWSRSRPYEGVDLSEPLIFSFIKHFDVSFEDFERVTKEEYLFHFESGSNMLNEGNEPPNPYLLYTFNLERIKDYYSLDQERYASARKWLEEWLSKNETYESYSAYKSANP